MAITTKPPMIWINGNGFQGPHLTKKKINLWCVAKPKMTEQYSVVCGIDAANVYAKVVHNHATRIADLEVKLMDLSDNGFTTNLTILIPSVCITASSN
eukprot:8485692-Ditylum_brightwellii.AAC.1